MVNGKNSVLSFHGVSFFPQQVNPNLITKAMRHHGLTIYYVMFLTCFLSLCTLFKVSFILPCWFWPLC